MKLRIACVVVAFLSLVQLTVAQTSAQTASFLPRLVRFGGTVKEFNGNPLTGVVGITFAFYSERTGGAPLWLETQNATADSSGHYTVLLGSTKPEGLPAELFTSEQARWVGVQVSGQAEQPRVLLVSAPYALKAGDAETVGGLPPSAFVLAAPLTIGSTSGSNTPATVPTPAATDVTTTGGTLNYLPIFSGADTITDSAVFQTGSGTTAKVGINTTTPATRLDVNGNTTVRGTLSLPATAVATATAGKLSQPLTLVASSFDKTSSTALPQTFLWQAEPAANDTAAPSGTLNLLYGLGATAPSETGLKVSSRGIFTFATGQTFPGTADGSVTSIATGLGLKGGPITKTGTLTIDTTEIPQLAGPNTFTGNQTVNGNVNATNVTASETVTAGVVKATASFDIGNTPFVFGSVSNFNAFLGFAGNSTTTGTQNTASGAFALPANTTGTENTVSGFQAMIHNTSGNYNTASGYNSLFWNTTGSTNVAIGYQAGNPPLGGSTTGSNNTFVGANSSPGAQNNLSNATAIGANAEVTASNSLVLGSIIGINSATATTNVGIGTTAPLAALDVAGNQVETVIGDPGCGAGFAGIAFSGKGFSGFDSCLNYSLAGDGDNTYINAAFGNVYFRSKNANTMFIGFNGAVGINTTAPDDALSVNGGADKTGGGSWQTFSDRRLKTLHGDFKSGLNQIVQLKPVRYRYKNDNAMGIHDTEEHVGLVAQEVRQIIPEAVKENSKGYLLIDNDPIIWSMLNAIKEQQRQIRQQQSLLRAQSSALRSLKGEVRETRDTLRKVKAQLAAAQPALVAAK